MTIRQIAETCLYVSDLHRTKDFYHHKLGLPLIALVENRHVFFRAGSSVLLCFISEATKNDERLPRHFGQGQLHFAFEVPLKDYETWKSKIGSLDIEIEKEVEWRKDLFSFYFRDPDNHCVEIIMPGLWK